MRKWTIFLFGLQFIIGIQLNAQHFEVPKNYDLVFKEEYQPYEKNIIEAAKWLTATPFNKEKEKRAEVDRFVITWINGSPTVNVEIFESIIGFDKKNKGMLVLYMAACGQYVLENNYSKDLKAKQQFAINTLIQVYKRGDGIKKDKKMEELIKMEASGQLETWMKENMFISNQ